MSGTTQENAWEFAELQSFIDENTDQDAINGRYTGRFSGGKNPGINPAQNNNRAQDSEKPSAKTLENAHAGL